MLEFLKAFLTQLYLSVSTVLVQFCFCIPSIFVMMSFVGSVLQDLADLGYKIDFGKNVRKYRFILYYIAFICAVCSPAFCMLYVILFHYRYQHNKQSFLEVLNAFNLLMSTTKLEDQIYTMNPTKIGVFGLYLHPYNQLGNVNVIGVQSKFKMDFICYYLDDNYCIVVPMATGKFLKLSEEEQRKFVFDYWIFDVKSRRFLNEYCEDLTSKIAIDPILDGNMGFDVVDESKLSVIQKQKLELIRERDALLDRECELLKDEKGLQKRK